MSVRVSPTEKIRAQIDALFDGSRELVEVLEDVARLCAQLIIETARTSPQFLPLAFGAAWIALLVAG